MYFSLLNANVLVCFLYVDVLAFGDIRDRASDRHHCPCCLVKDYQFYYESDALFTELQIGSPSLMINTE